MLNSSWMWFQINSSTIKLSLFNSHNVLFLVSVFLLLLLCLSSLRYVHCNWFAYLKFECSGNQRSFSLTCETPHIYWRWSWHERKRKLWQFLLLYSPCCAEDWIYANKSLSILTEQLHEKTHVTTESKKSNQRPFTIVDINQGANEV